MVSEDVNVSFQWRVVLHVSAPFSAMCKTTSERMISLPMFKCDVDVMLADDVGAVKYHDG